MLCGAVSLERPHYAARGPSDRRSPSPALGSSCTLSTTTPNFTTLPLSPYPMHVPKPPPDDAPPTAHGQHVRVKRLTDTYFVSLDLQHGATARHLHARTAVLMNVSPADLRLCRVQHDGRASFLDGLDADISPSRSSSSVTAAAAAATDNNASSAANNSGDSDSFCAPHTQPRPLHELKTQFDIPLMDPPHEFGIAGEKVVYAVLRTPHGWEQPCIVDYPTNAAARNPEPNGTAS